MREIRMCFIGAIAALALGGCTWMSSLGTTSPSQAATVGGAEVAYTAAANTATLWVQSGKATKAQAAVAASMDKAVYSDIVVARTAAENNDSAAIATALALYNQAMDAFTGYIASNGGGH